MPRSYRRKSASGSIPRVDFEVAAIDVRMGMSNKCAARVHKVDRMTLTRFIIRSQSGGERSTGYEGTARAHTILTPAMKEDLAAHIKDLGDQFLGLSPDKCYEFAMQNEVPMPGNWKKQQIAGNVWFAGFKERQNLPCRKQEQHLSLELRHLIEMQSPNSLKILKLSESVILLHLIKCAISTKLVSQLFRCLQRKVANKLAL